MELSREEIRELSRILDARTGRKRREKPRLRLITPPSPKLLDPIFRDAHIRRILHLQRAYRLQWLVDQATFSVASLSCLEDCDLIRLLADMERARECIADGVSFEDAGLVRSIADQLPSVPDHEGEQQAEYASMGWNQQDRCKKSEPSGEPPF